MPRYVAKPNMEYELYEGPLLPEIQVESAAPANTGLIDQHGNPIYRMPDEIGFIHGIAKRGPRC